MSGRDEPPSRYGGSAAYYAAGRLPYPAATRDVLGAAVSHRPGSRLLDVGCGPGTLALLLADRFDQVVGVDADPDMVAAARRQAAAAGARHLTFVQRRAEDLTADLGRFTAATFGQSFHWVDQDVVAARVRRLLAPGAPCALVHAWSLRGDEVAGSPHPLPPYAAVDELLDRHLGPDRVGRPEVDPDDQEALPQAGFRGPERLAVPGGDIVVSSVEDLVARSLSTSAAAPARFGGDPSAFVTDLRDLLRSGTPTGRFAERLRDALVLLWRSPPG